MALDATPPLSSGGGAVLVVKQEHVLNGPPTNNFNALVNAAVVQVRSCGVFFISPADSFV